MMGETAKQLGTLIEVGLLERTHGSALFTRGETQAIVAATLGTERYSQIIDALEGEYKDKFMLHYNFPPFSVGEMCFIKVHFIKDFFFLRIDEHIRLD